MRILFLSDNFPPEVNAPASRTFEHCREWVRMGHEVTVVTCAPNFPHGRLLGGYRNRLWQTEQMDGIRVVRVWSYITRNEGFARRTLDYLSFMMTGTIGSLFVRRPDIVVATSPQFFVACAGYAVSRLKRIPFVFELRDLWPDSIKAVGAMEDSVLIRWLNRLEAFLYRKAAGIVCVTESFKQTLTARGIDETKITVVTNGADLTLFAPRPRDEELRSALGLQDKFVAGYVGTHGLAHGLETILEAAELLRDSNAERFRFLFLGDGARKAALMEMARQRDLKHVLFLDSVPKHEVARYWSLLDVAIIHLRNEPLFRGVIPSKLFECMALRIPVLHGVAGESRDIVVSAGVGLPFEPGNACELAAALTRMADDPTLLACCREACARAAPGYERTQLARRMAAFLEALIGDSALRSDRRQSRAP